MPLNRKHQVLLTDTFDMNSVFNKRYTYSDNPWLYHALFWLCYFIINTIRWGHYFNDYIYSVKSNLVEFPLHIMLVYFTLYYLMPKFLPKKVGHFIVILFISTLLITFVRIILTYELVTTEVFKESGRDEKLFGLNYIAAAFFGELYVLGVVTAIKITIDWIKFKNKASELQKSQLETELAYLKSQIQPHFFFNTLNNLYSLTLDKSDKAPETVIKLSELMSYVIYDSAKSMVPLEDEISHVQNYIDLERLRFGDRLNLQFSINGDISGIEVPPLLFIPYIENAFKHGASTRKEHIPIKISFNIEPEELVFLCENEVSEEEPAHQKLIGKWHQGIGLKNTERRLKLRYDNNYDLNVKIEKGLYKVVLKLPIK